MAAARNVLGLLLAMTLVGSMKAYPPENAIAAYRAGPGLEREDAAFALADIWAIAALQGRYEEVKALLEALVRRAVLGDEHPDTATTWSTSAGSTTQGNWRRRNRSIAGDRDSAAQLGANDPVVGQTDVQPRPPARVKGDRAGAVEAFRQAAAILEQAYGPNDEDGRRDSRAVGALGPSPASRSAIRRSRPRASAAGKG
ncbi:MAG: hypothetical protein R2724_29620 [Bryobacterales bacterium]